MSSGGRPTCSLWSQTAALSKNTQQPLSSATGPPDQIAQPVGGKMRAATSQQKGAKGNLLVFP